MAGRSYWAQPVVPEPGGPAEIVMGTAEPAGAASPPAGDCALTRPAGTAGSACLAVCTSNPADCSAAVACSSVSASTLGTVAVLPAGPVVVGPAGGAVGGGAVGGVVGGVVG